MTTLFLYVLASSHDPDNMECLVPYQISEKVIFFGPCKKHLREWLRENYLKKLEAYSFPDYEDVFVVGVNGSNPQHKRKIVWAGRITGLMTFETAYNERNSIGFQEMLRDHFSPLHVQPVYGNANRFLGYKHTSRFHQACWISDISGEKITRLASYVQLTKESILLKQGVDRCQVFTRDCCFLCESVFFAQRDGMSITEKMLGVLRQVQPSKKIDKYAIFGCRTDGSADGFTGRYLTLCGKQAEDLMHLIKNGNPISPRTIKKPLKPCNCQ